MSMEENDRVENVQSECGCSSGVWDEGVEAVSASVEQEHKMPQFYLPCAD